MWRGLRLAEPFDRLVLGVVEGLKTKPGPHGDEVAVLRSFRPINRAQEPRLRGGSFVAVALHATAGLASNRFSAGCRLSFMPMGGDAPW